jgi:hypothetical protein
MPRPLAFGEIAERGFQQPGRTQKASPVRSVRQRASGIAVAVLLPLSKVQPAPSRLAYFVTGVCTSRVRRPSALSKVFLNASMSFSSFSALDDALTLIGPS